MKHVILCYLFIYPFFAFGQSNAHLSSDDIFQRLNKLNTLGNAMYLAAHPDDENTTMISFLTNKMHFNTVYLSLTRGDGGQNLIGTELGSSLGVIRTHELLEARKIDGGMQWFTRANDFGFSKHPEETMQFWNEDEILKDMVGTIRRFRPDVIINRFSTKNPGETHGHHSASAILAEKAIELASDPKYIIPGLNFAPWSVTNMYCNTSRFFFRSQEDFDKADKSALYSVDCGVYYPLLGYSNGEMSARSRSMHRSQGFGAAYNRGSQIEYLELLTGPQPTIRDRPFDDLQTSWSRIKGGEHLGTLVNNTIRDFDFKNPGASIPVLISIAKAIDQVEDPFWREIKREEIRTLILSCAGFYSEFVTDQQLICPGDSLNIYAELIYRNGVKVNVGKVEIKNVFEKNETFELANNQRERKQYRIKVPDDMALSSPYWLKGKFSPNMYDVKDPALAGQPENEPPLVVWVDVIVEDYKMTVPVEVLFKTVNPAFGQKYDAIQIVPPVSVNFIQPCIVGRAGAVVPIRCEIVSSAGSLRGNVSLDLPAGWKSTPQQIPVEFSFKNERREVVFMIGGPEFEGIDSIGATIESGGNKYSNNFEELNYEHIPYRVINMPNKIPFSVVPGLETNNKIGFIDGAGDLVFESLKFAGYDIEKITSVDFSVDYFKKYKSIILGIRLFNVNDQSALLNSILNDYVHSGGRVIVQYNTSRGVKIPQIGPFPIQLGRTRVTDENAPVTIIDPSHPALNTPHKISSGDFDHWVQERGIYFAETFDTAYRPLLRMNDPGEKPSDGALIIADFGKGKYIITGLSLFRELPAGVPGAYKLMDNILAL